MSQSLSAWISAARPRTLPLSVSGILFGSAIAYYKDFFDPSIFALALLTTILFQVLSNFANDYGDGIKGTDNENRIGPARALQSGKISKKDFKTGIVITSIFSLISSIVLIYLAFGKENFILSLLFFGLGVLSIIAAIKYTVGDSAYGYKGLGDVFVFVFFGLVSVCGSYMLYAISLDILLLLPGIAIGCLSSAVLNLNNMRDLESDSASHKNTLVVKLGLPKAKVYHATLIVMSLAVLVIFLSLNDYKLQNFICLLPYIIIIKHLVFTLKNKEPRAFDPELKKVALSTFGISLLFFISMLF